MMTAALISTEGAVVAPEEASVDGLQSCRQGTMELLHALQPLVVKGNSGYDCRRLKSVWNREYYAARSFSHHCSRHNSHEGNEV